MARLQISTHGRLQEWIAHEKGYFTDEGLDYDFDVALLEVGAELNRSEGGAPAEYKEGAFEHYATGEHGKKGLSCACHWAVNEAAGEHRGGRMWGGAYSVIPCGVYVPPESAITTPEDLADVDVAVGYHSGSHFATLQALEPFLNADQIKLRFLGYPYDRVDLALDRQVPALTAWGAATYLLEQQGFRQVTDATFIGGFMFADDIDPADVEHYFRALKRAQMDLDLAPERYKHYYLREVPERFHALIDVRRFGPGERIAFLPYSADMYQESQEWLRERQLFPGGSTTPANYESVVKV